MLVAVLKVVDDTEKTTKPGTSQVTKYDTSSVTPKIAPGEARTDLYVESDHRLLRLAEACGHVSRKGVADRRQRRPGLRSRNRGDQGDRGHHEPSHQVNASRFVAAMGVVDPAGA
jgi:hypothetical protein